VNACTGSWSSKGYRTQEFPFSSNPHCDLCSDVTVLAWDRWMPIFKTGTYGSFHNSGWTLKDNGKLERAMQKALAPINDVNRKVNALGDITKARYGEEEAQAANAIYVMDIQAMLEKDFTVSNEQLAHYRLWTNTMTQQDQYLLPNAGRLFRGTGLDYVSEILNYTDPDTGTVYPVEVITALNRNAFEEPVVSIGSAASLDFSTGTLKLPSKADLELYQHEVSGGWLMNNILSGRFRIMDTPIGDVNAFVNGETEEVPTGDLLTDIAPSDEVNGWKLYWLGDNPETAQDEDQTLIGLAYNEEFDELLAFRTTRAAFEPDRLGALVSLYIFRDSKSDRMGEEKYNVLLYDVPAGEAGEIRFITNVLGGRELELPKALNVTMRGMEIEGTSLPVFCMTNHFFIMCDGTAGGVNLYDGIYTNTFDGDTFDSDYLRIEGIRDNNLTVTIKQDQPVWPEKLDETHAVDGNGDRYTQNDSGEWEKEEVSAA